MRHIEIDAAQEILESLLDEFERGVTIMLTRNGVAVARMVPFDETREDRATPQQT